MSASQNGRTIAMETTTGLNKQTFAAFIAAKRKAAGMTQEELARQLYVDVYKRQPQPHPL